MCSTSIIYNYNKCHINCRHRHRWKKWHRFDFPVLKNLSVQFSGFFKIWKIYRFDFRILEKIADRFFHRFYVLYNMYEKWLFIKHFILKMNFSLVLLFFSIFTKCVIPRTEKRKKRENYWKEKNQSENGLKRTIWRGCIQLKMNFYFIEKCLNQHGMSILKL